MSDIGSPLIGGAKLGPAPQTATFEETPEGKALRLKEADDADWKFWQDYTPHVVEFAKAAITPEMTDERKQAILKATFQTFTDWHNS
jgi:hypothetical protein